MKSNILNYNNRLDESSNNKQNLQTGNINECKELLKQNNVITLTTYQNVINKRQRFEYFEENEQFHKKIDSNQIMEITGSNHFHARPIHTTKQASSKCNAQLQKKFRKNFNNSFCNDNKLQKQRKKQEQETYITRNLRNMFNKISIDDENKYKQEKSIYHSDEEMMDQSNDDIPSEIVQKDDQFQELCQELLNTTNKYKSKKYNDELLRFMMLTDLSGNNGKSKLSEFLSFLQFHV